MANTEDTLRFTPAPDSSWQQQSCKLKKQILLHPKKLMYYWFWFKRCLLSILLWKCSWVGFVCTVNTPHITSFCCFCFNYAWVGFTTSLTLSLHSHQCKWYNNFSGHCRILSLYDYRLGYVSNGDKKFIYSRDILGRNIPAWSRKIVTNRAANKLQYICDTDCKVVSWTGWHTWRKWVIQLGP